MSCKWAISFGYRNTWQNARGMRSVRRMISAWCTGHLQRSRCSQDLAYLRELADAAVENFELVDFSEQRWGPARLGADPATNRTSSNSCQAERTF